MIKRAFFLILLIFLFPLIANAQLSFQEGRKIWKNYSASQYDERLRAAAVNFPDRFRVSTNRGADLGPVSIRLDDFVDGDHPYFEYWVRVAALPNLELDNQVSLKLIIRHVWDLEKNDLYNREAVSRQSLQNIIGDDALTFISKLYLKQGSDVRVIQEISGEIVFILPLELTWLTFEKSDLKKKKQVPGIVSTVSLSNLRFKDESSWVEIRYQGKEEAYLTTLAYDKTGKQLKKKGFAKNSVSEGWLYAYAFAGQVEKIQTLFSSHVIERKYPFKIVP
ncbi:MAG: hypothetical protein GXO96_11330 [Nitrospirae bacterium]|nr:hypothetical protein [Candidatus Manganitrophaceae bacterium]